MRQPLVTILSGVFLGALWLPASVPAAPPRTLESGLSPTERALFYHIPLGSEIIPLSWMEALTDVKTGKRFLDVVDRFGMLADADHPLGLPIGMSHANSGDARFQGQMVGLTCAVCHVGELHHKGHVVRIVGAPNLLRIEAFVQDLAASMAATLKSPKKLFQFVRWMREHPEHGKAMAKTAPGAHTIFGDHGSLEELAAANPNLAAALEEAHAEVAAWERTAMGHVTVGGTRPVDPQHRKLLTRFTDLLTDAKAALGTYVEVAKLVKARLSFLLKMRKVDAELPVTAPGPGRNDDWTLGRNVVFGPQDWMAPQAPAAFPDLWGYNKAKWLTWNGATTSGMERGVATVIGLFALFDPKTHSSTVSMLGLGVADDLALKIRSPRWPEDIFGKVDTALVSRGAKLYREHCAQCHDAPSATPLRKIGTDPLHALGFLTPMTDGRPFVSAFAAEMAAYKRAAYAAQGLTPATTEKLEAPAPDMWKSVYRYVSRPLAGVWATAPFLHNGSVPTIYDLLLPPDKRPRTFSVGHRDYDPVKLGFTTVVKDPIWIFDVSEPGNDNGGHIYGTELSEADRAALLEYIKSL